MNKYEIRQKGKRWVVWNTEYGYVEHIGSEESCRQWLENVKGIFG